MNKKKVVLIGAAVSFAIAAILDDYYDSIVDRLISYSGEALGIDVCLLLGVLLLSAVYFAFSGYSDMGRGISAMLGIPLEPDFGSAILSYTPLIYARNFLSSLSDWIDDYIRRPLHGMLGIEKRAGFSRIALGTAVSVVCSLALLTWFKIGVRALPAIAILLIPAILDGLFNSDAFVKKHKALIPISWLFTLTVTTLFWMLIRTRNLSNLERVFSKFALSQPLQSYLISQTFFNLEFPLVLAMILLVQLPMIFGTLSGRRRSAFASTPAVRWVWSLLILSVFVFSIYYYLPQYPALATEPFRDIIF